MVQLYSRDGAEFAVNDVTAGYQGQPATVRLASGEFVIVWTSFVSSGIFELRGQLYAADGTPVGDDFPVTGVSANLGDARVEALSTGGFIVTWTHDVHDGTGTNAAAGTAFRIHAQIFDSTAAKLGGELSLSSGTLANHSDPQVAALANGAFAVSYTRSTSTNNVLDSDVVVQAFDSAGVATGPVTVVSASSTGTQNSSGLAAMAGGGFVATWADTNSAAAGDPFGQGIKAQFFDSAGAKVGGEFLVNSVTPGTQYQPNVAVLASGGFVITWTHLIGGIGDPNGNDIKAQIFTAAGGKVGGEFTVNTITTATQAGPAVTALADGGFVIGWRDQSVGEDDLKAQVFDSSGARQGIEFTLSTDNAGFQGSLALTGLAGGGFVAAWAGNDASPPGVKAQIFAPGAGAPTDIALSSAALTENAVENIAVAMLSVVGAANSGFSYQIVADSTGGAFRIDGDKLVVEDNAKLDFETAPQASVTVRVTDLNGQTYDEVLVLDVTDIAQEKRFSADDAVVVHDGPQQAIFGSTAVSLTGGGFALIWAQFNLTYTPGSPQTTRLRVYDAAGQPTTGEIVIADDWLHSYSAVPLANGGFVIVRQADHEPSGTFSVKAQTYDAAGNPVGAEMAAGTTQSGYVGSPAIVQLSTGGFVIAFVTPQGEVHGQLFSAAKVAIGAEFTITAVFQQSPVGLAAGPDGGFVASWVATETETGGEAKVQRFDPSGVPTGAPLTVPLGLDPGSVTLLALAGGGYVFTWVELVGEDLGLGLYAVMGQPIGANGAAVGGPVLLTGFVAEADTGEINFAADPGGGFVVTWPVITGAAEDYLIYGVAGQLFDPAGVPLGPQLQPTGLGWTSDVVVLADGSIVAAWTAGDQNRTDVFARVYRPANETIDLSGNDVLTGDGGANLLDGEGGNDQLYGLGGVDALIGGTGNDRLDGGGGADVMTGGAGNDIYVVDDAGDSINEDPGAGMDEVETALAAYSLVALPNVENLTATSNVNHDFRGNSGNNVVTGGSGVDIFRLYDGGNDTVLGGAGDDLIFMIGSLTAADVVNGGTGTDTVIIQGNYAGGLTLSANVTQIENITILGGSNTSFGEPGTNLYDYVITTNNVNFAAGIQARINGAALLAGEDFTFNGSAETDAKFVVYGGKGVDTLTGGFGNDVFIYAEDRFAPGDTVNGGPGGYDGIFLRGNYTIDFNAPGYFGLLTSIENMTLTSITDERYARGGDPAGFDYNITLADNQLLAGVELTVSGTYLTSGETMVVDGSLETDGNFRFFAGRADDVLKGGANNDLLLGYLGADILTGGGGADTFRYDTTADSNSASMDHILDFRPGTDKIELSRTDANELAAGDQAFSWIGSNAFSNVAGQLRAFQQGGEWILQGDTNGDGIADLVISLTLQGPTPLGAGDFLL